MKKLYKIEYLRRTPALKSDQEKLAESSESAG